jgi:hypothetical protein
MHASLIKHQQFASMLQRSHRRTVLTCENSATSHYDTQAFGAIFQLDVLTDVAAGLLQPVWASIAKEYNYPAPTALQCQRAMGMLPEMAVMREFRWTQVHFDFYSHKHNACTVYV